MLKKIKERLGIYISRPRVLKLEGGEVSLQGFSKEQADVLSAHIKSFGNTTLTLPSLPTDLVFEEQVSNALNLPDRAIGVHIDKSNMEVNTITVAYNIKTKQAEVLEVTKSDNMKAGIIAFKMLAAKYNFV